MNESNIARRNSHWKRKLLIALSIIALIGLTVYSVFFIVKKTQANKITIKTIKEAWNNNYDYNSVYNLSKSFLEENPFNNTALTYHGYACFFLAVAQDDNFQAQEYLDECINNLRLALYDASQTAAPQIEYMLGKAYFYKNSLSTYFYSDLAVRYLTLAKEHGYVADDIAEYLGLSYAALDMTMESISSFTEALLVRESDSLLLSIAEQYYKAGEYTSSVQYLYRIINNTENEDMLIKSRILLATIYIEMNNYDDALKEFNAVIENNDNSADAHYGIGLIYEKQNNTVKARAEWRNALKIQPNHAGALKKLYNN
ncbi:MAG: tetratricopeptide repeat protein [Treponema sp.]|nr:tetratricopeptide repeat protein [Treponema sp.]